MKRNNAPIVIIILIFIIAGVLLSLGVNHSNSENKININYYIDTIDTNIILSVVATNDNDNIAINSLKLN